MQTKKVQNKNIIKYIKINRKIINENTMKLCIEINKNIDKKYRMRTHQINSGNLIIMAHVF